MDVLDVVCCNLSGDLHGVGVTTGANGGVYASVSLARMVVVVVYTTDQVVDGAPFTETVQNPGLGLSSSSTDEVDEVIQLLLVALGARVSSDASVVFHPGMFFHGASEVKIGVGVVAGPGLKPGGSVFGKSGTGVDSAGGGTKALGGRLPKTGGFAELAGKMVALPPPLMAGGRPGRDTELPATCGTGNLVPLKPFCGTCEDSDEELVGTSIVAFACRGSRGGCCS